MKKVFAVFIFLLLISAQNTYAQVLINEFSPRGNPEWVEFYNKSNGSVDLGNYSFDDDTDFNSDSGTSSKINLSGIMPSLTTCYWEMNSFLNDSGDNPTLFAQNGDLVDTYSYASSSATTTYLRIPDGGDWQIGVSSKSSISCLSLPTPTPTPTLSPSPTPTPTTTPSPTLTPTHTPSPTPKPTITPTSTLSPTPTATSTTSPSPEIVAAETGEVLSDKVINEDQPKKFPVVPAIILALGIFAVLVSIFLFVSKRLKDYNDFNVPKKDN